MLRPNPKPKPKPNPKPKPKPKSKPKPKPKPKPMSCFNTVCIEQLIANIKYGKMVFLIVIS